MCDVVGDLFAESNPSDHIPVSASIAPQRSRHPLLRAPIPRYSVESPIFDDLPVKPAADEPLPEV